MLVDRKIKLQLRAQAILFYALVAGLVGLLAYLSTRYEFEADWTATRRNSLSQASIDLLKTLDQPVGVTAFARDNEAARDAIRLAIGRYQKHKADVTLEFVNPDTAPDRVRAEGISTDGEMIVAYGGRTEKLTSRDESDLTNALQRLARSRERYLVFVEGHGERDPRGQRNFDLGVFGEQLTGKGFKLQSLNLTATPRIPDNTAVLVVAGPQVDYLPAEVKLIQDFVAGGGNFLWLGDPGPQRGFAPLATSLGAKFLAGMIVDPSLAARTGDPALIPVVQYRPTAITRDFSYLTLYPQATAVEVAAPEGWRAESFLTTLPDAWLETGKLAGAVEFNENGADRRGPLDIGWMLTRQIPGKPAEGAATEDAPEASGREQRVVLIGDGDFLSNTFLGNPGNLDLGLNVMNWLAHDDAFINIAVKQAEDLAVQLSETEELAISFALLIGLPLGLVGSGLVIWWRRRRR